MNVMTIRKLDSVILVAAVLLLHSADARCDAGDNPVLLKVMFNQVERRGSGGDREDWWETDAWLGRDLDKVWLRSRGRRSSGDTQDAEVQIMYSKAASTYWDFQTGIRRDFEPAPRDWLAVGFHGLAPYFFKVDTALFLGESGHTALRAEAEYDLRLTQRLILTPDLEFNIYGKDDPAAGRGSGLSDINAGLRLRYEIRREFAPYVGITWVREYGETARLSQAAGRTDGDTKIAIGFRAWF